jgi:hypothetical protein
MELHRLQILTRRSMYEETRIVPVDGFNLRFWNAQLELEGFDEREKRCLHSSEVRSEHNISALTDD